MNEYTLDFYKVKLQRKQNLLAILKIKENDAEYKMSIGETIRLNVLDAEVTLIKEMIEDVTS